jgi:hypothetical protein
MTYMIFPYKSASQGAKDIAEGLGGKRIKRSGSSYVPKDSDVIINWGASDNPYPQALNAKTKNVLSKLAFFDRCKYEGITPRYATTKDGALALNCQLVCRQTDKGRDGEGIVIWTGDGPLPDASLYVELLPKTEEYRVHMGRTPMGLPVIIGIQRKYSKGSSPIWVGHSCKFVWTLNGLPVLLPTAARDVAVKTLQALSEIDFAGLDIIYDNETGKAHVLEANSAPMMTPKTVDCYAVFFKEYYPS